ncbi:MAG: hypothetical protein KDB90_12520 [Planctomycetes bacterium]|nr:hypothetical protein [Planctomycetota bacterium]
MAFWNRLFKKESAVAEADKDDVSPSEPVAKPAEGAIVPGEGAKPGTGKVPKKGFLGKFESQVRRKVDSYVDNKADALLDDATRRAEQFRQETIDEVHSQAMKLLDVTETRIDEKLVEIEDLLEKRLRAELKMRLRAMLWTLVFVLIMAAVSFAYVWVKRSTGLDEKTNTEQVDK